MARLLLHDLRAIDATRIGAPFRVSPLPHAPGAEAALLVAPIVGQGIALGAFQRARSTLDLPRLEGTGIALVRRATGGPAIRVGRGQIYVALDLRAPSALSGAADPGRALNRHVRPLLAAITSLSSYAATSGGRDVVLVRGEPVAWVSVRHERATGRTGLEAVVALDEPFALDERLDLAHGAIAPRWTGKRPTTLRAVLDRAIEPAAVVEAVVRAYAAVAGGDVERVDPPSLPASRVEPDQAPFVAMVEESIGLLGGVVERDRLVLGGDLVASQDVLDALGATLFALGPDADEVGLGRAIDEAFGPGSGAMLLGVRSLSSIEKLVRATWAATKADARG